MVLGFTLTPWICSSKTNVSDALRNKSMLHSCISGGRLLSFMKNVTFKGTSGKISFDVNGDMTGEYDILQFIFGRTSEKTIKVGAWDKQSGDLFMMALGLHGSTKKAFMGLSYQLIFQNPCAVNLANENSTNYNKKSLAVGNAHIAETMNIL